MKNFRLNLIIRVLLLTFSIGLFSFILFTTELVATLVIISLTILYQIFSIIKYIDSTNRELTRFLHSIKHSDFSQTFTGTSLGSSFKELNIAFNEVIEEFQKTRGEKEENFRYLQTVMQHVGIGLISYDQSGSVEFINTAARKILNIPHLKNIQSLNSVSKDLGYLLMNIKAGGRHTIKIVDEDELTQLTAYATEFKLRSRRYTLISLQNIQNELEEKEMDAWQKLIRVLTHEIMNSITPISSLAQTVSGMLAQNGGAPVNEEMIKDISLAVNTIQKRSEGLIHFVDDYRNLTRIPKPDFQIFPIKSLFERIDKLMGAEIRGRGILTSIEIRPETLELTADPQLIEQVLINLIINAVYVLGDIKQPSLKLIAHLDERGKIVIKVIDNGPGISEELREKIFIPFYSTKKDGSGIGLPLSRQIMRSHNGSIRVTSTPWKETIFTLKF